MRPATPADLPAMIALERASLTAAHWSDAEYALLFDAGATSRIALVAAAPEHAGFIVARCAGPDWEIENVVVAPEFRGRGIGLALVTAVIDRANSARAEAVHLEVRASNSAARALYRRAGFIEIGARPHYYDHPDEDAVLYRFQCSRSLELDTETRN
ncbi:MAG: ribosomal protein S18-alanine N-acetyltransferase [Terriglobales bacterium]